MNELLSTGIDKNMTSEQKTNTLRENLQIMILKMLSDRGAFKHIIFVGGTALRIVYGLNRFSEDLDFSLSGKKGFEFKTLENGLKTDLDKTGLKYSAKAGGEFAVKYLFLKFPGLLEDIGARRIKSQNLSVKLEVDMNPPAGWDLEAAVINRFYIFQVNVYKIESLFAGKIHACLFRTYVKARDYYDLLWYLTKKIKPNLKQLNNAARQTDKEHPEITSANLPALILDKLEKIDFKQVRSDVSKFLANPDEAGLLSFETFKNLLVKYEF